MRAVGHIYLPKARRPTTTNRDCPPRNQDGSKGDGRECSIRLLRGRFASIPYGFRPMRSQHDALDALVVGITSTKVNWILEVDIRSFFDEVS